ncbi:MAG TPA: TIGR01841 family phasin [Burkholderiaceae bacterium]|jgi:phasin family protein|nr:TIGR01841 family phasin [Burkholderiaceae bacterium]
MFSFSEQLSSATKANFNAQIDFFSALSNKAFESVEKVVDLNISAIKATLEDSAAVTKQLLSAKDPQEFLSLSAAQAQPNAQKAIAYSRHLAGIASSAQVEFSKAADEQIAEANRKVIALVNDIAKNAPAGAENAIALMKSAIGNANAGYEQFSKTAKQAAEALEINMNTAVSQFSQATEKTASRTHAH